jgi:hypothetical protein
MRSASIAEWLLRRLTSKERATSMVGDLVEVGEQKGIFWFWLSMTGIVLSLVWRRPLAFVAAFYFGSWVYGTLLNTTYGLHAQHRPPALWGPVFNVLGPTGSLLWIAAIYATIRFGFHDRFAQSALAMASIVVAVNCYWWQPAIVAACIASSLCLIGVSVMNSERRRAALGLVLVLAAGFAGGLLALYLAYQYQKFVCPGPVGDRELREHPSISWVGLCMWILATWITTSASLLVQRWVTRRESVELEAEPSSAV